MEREIKQVVVVGAGSAGLLAALSFQRAFPALQITVIHSPDVPVVGVGESTTALFPPFLHQSLGIDAQEFFRQVQPGWKLGIRFLWGDPNDTHFNYPFDESMGNKPAMLQRMPAFYCLEDGVDASRCSALMDRNLSPCLAHEGGRITVEDSFGYHLQNDRLIELLTATVTDRGIQMIAGHVDHAVQSDDGDIKSLVLDDGRAIPGDLFVDCSGFESRLLSGVMGASFTDYSDSLFCDTAVIGRWNREQPFLPYTTAETMDHGWCWQIEFNDHVTRGYVFASDFCSQDEALAEFRAANPQLEADVRFVRFRSGRYDEFWKRNVIALGNASGFAEPLEATALHLVIEQVRLVCRILSESSGCVVPALRDVGNRRYRELWDEVRDFLAVHYRFNRRRDTPFWRHCREHVDLAGATELVDLYQQAGPSSLCSTTLPGGHVFGYDGFINLLVGQRVETSFEGRISEDERHRWNAYRDDVRSKIRSALPMSEAYRMITA